MKRVLLGLLLVAGFVANSQVYNNEWIDYSKTYYKFKVGKTGLYRIPQATLAAAGLGNAAAEQFQLWRNGVQVPVYTSVASGALSSADYIEFWGEMNDGKPDKALYRNPDYQLNDKWSLLSDSAVYFLTVNPASSNFRLVNTANNVAGTSLPVEPYFMHTVGMYFRDRINGGEAADAGEYVYSSSYDRGEGWSSGDIQRNGTHSTTLPNLYVYGGGPSPKFKIAVSGNVLNRRRFNVRINGTPILENGVDFFNYKRDSVLFSIATLSANKADVVVTNNTEPCPPAPEPCRVSDRMVIHQYEITYPREFNFGGAANFAFNLPASAAGTYLQISNFSFGSTAPVLYDLTNGKRYVADISAAPLVKVVLEPSAVERKLVLVSEEATNVAVINTALQQRNFINYNTAASQGDFLIITNELLLNNSGGNNPVEEYRAYRSSATGGAFNAKVYLTDELIDQFGFGIKKSPLGLRNFLLFARHKFPTQPKNVFLIGKSVNYTNYWYYDNTEMRYKERNGDIDKLNLVPTYGWPASDVLLTANPGSSMPQISVGRLSVVNTQEIAIYLEKVKEYELVQKTPSPAIQDKAWMKNVVHVVGASEPKLQDVLDRNMTKYKQIISDTLFGAKVTTFSKTSVNEVEQIANANLQNLFTEGISMITYFGHSSSTTLQFNLDNPELYNNPNKYPLFVALGCSAGDFYNYTPSRLQSKETLSEKFVLAPDRGTIGFIAGTHFGIVHYLDIFNTRFYKSVAHLDYGKSVGEQFRSAIRQSFDFASEEDFYIRCTSEELALNGDPAIIINSHPKPDYVIEDPSVKLSPAFISLSEPAFKVGVKVLNIGKAVNNQVVVQVTKQYSDQTPPVSYRDTLQKVLYADSLNLNIMIAPLVDKNLNKVVVTIDPDNQVDELFETNNSVSKDVFVYEDEARPIYPYNFSIVNKQGIKLVASTVNAFSESKQFKMEIDTTEKFISPLSSKTITSKGGVIEFDPGISFQNEKVYYWRIASTSNNGQMKASPVSSFIYLSNSNAGLNQSHRYQQLKSDLRYINIDSVNGKMSFEEFENDLTIRNATYPSATTNDYDFHTYINGFTAMGGGCHYNELIFSVVDPVTFKPWKNNFSGGGGLYNSLSSTCAPQREFNFEYSLATSADRKKAMDFIDLVPEGSLIIIRTNTYPWSESGNTYSNVWKSDTSIHGTGNSLYHKLLNHGFTAIDSFNRARAFIFIFKKGQADVFTPKSVFSQGIYDKISLTELIESPASQGNITSPVFGPAKAWKQFLWKGSSLDNAEGDQPLVDIIGVRADGSKNTLFTGIRPSQAQLDIASVNAREYPFMQLSMLNKDSVFHTPYQLEYWRLTYDPAPEGALAPNIYMLMKDTLQVGEPLDFKIAFKNVSDVGFDSLKVKMVVTDANNVQHVLPVQRHRPLNMNDTLHIRYNLDTRQLNGLNSLYIEVNPDNDQLEQYHFNNFAYKNFFVGGDKINPLLDVTFNNVHILNNDIVSSKPDILIKLKDDSKWHILDDTALVNIKVRYPDGTIRNFHFNNDTLRFTPAQNSTSENTATVQFNPYFKMDGNYELIVSGKDKSGNQTSGVEYRVAFEVNNKPMISNLLNYPNPFTTSTAFVFTITGNEVPQEFKIQILTVTGKVVREVTRQELGPLHIGRNITEFKWDGTDQFGQKLANGVYLYRTITSLNGKSLEKYKAKDDNTDKFYNNGYGKMYLMR